MSRPKLPFIFEDPRYWREWEVEFVRRHYTEHPTEVLAHVLGRSLSSVYQLGHKKLGLKKNRELLVAMAAWHASRPDHGMRKHQFPKGHRPANKGLRRPGYCVGGMARSQFKKGSCNGRAAQLVMPLGSHRLIRTGSRCPDPVLWRKVGEEPGAYTKRWAPVHRLVVGRGQRSGPRRARRRVQARHEDDRAGGDHPRPPRAADPRGADGSTDQCVESE